MIKKYLILFLLSTFFGLSATSQQNKNLPWKYRAGVNLNGIRTRSLELSGQALKGGKYIYNFNLGYTYQTPRNGFQTKDQKANDSLALVLKTSGFFVKTGVQANILNITNKFSKADLFVGAGVTNTWYNRSTTYTDIKPVIDVKKIGEFKGSSLAPYLSFGSNLRLLYNVYLDLGVQYNLTNAQTNDNLTPKRYDYIPGMGGNFKNGNKATFLFMARYQFD
ncbi:MAG: hypothetical protein V4683_17875 [Bacteroidota bacterium]